MQRAGQRFEQQLAVPATAERGIHKQTASRQVITGVLRQRLRAAAPPEPAMA